MCFQWFIGRNCYGYCALQRRNALLLHIEAALSFPVMHCRLMHNTPTHNCSPFSRDARHSWRLGPPFLSLALPAVCSAGKRTDSARVPAASAGQG